MNETVLIVNENVNERIIAETLLRSCGIPVLTAQHSMEALEILEKPHSKVGVLLIDLDEMMPGVSAWELLRSLRRRFDGIPLDVAPRVVVQSEREEAETESFIRRLGAEAFLLKPTPPAELIHTVGAMLQASRDEPSCLRMALAR